MAGCCSCCKFSISQCKLARNQTFCQAFSLKHLWFLERSQSEFFFFCPQYQSEPVIAGVCKCRVLVRYFIKVSARHILEKSATLKCIKICVISINLLTRDLFDSAGSHFLITLDILSQQVFQLESLQSYKENDVVLMCCSC